MDSWFNLKEQPITYRPSLLFQIDFLNGTTLYVTTPFNGQAADADTRYTAFNNNVYQSCVAEQSISALQSSAGLGVDTFGSISIALSDAGNKYGNYEAAFGFGGANLKALFAFFDPETWFWSPDFKVVFEGMCDPAMRDGDLLRINAISNYSLQRSIFPPFPLQRLCPKDFPTNDSERNSAAADPLSPFFECGYNPTAGFPVGAGNMNGGSYFTSCPKDRAACVQRGMFSSDSSGRNTQRFGGLEWIPPATWKGNSYTQGKLLQGVNSENLAKYSQYAPITYGTTWVSGICDNVVGDPNSTAAEVILGSFDYDLPTVASWKDVVKIVVVNGLKVPFQTDTSDILFRWYNNTGGARNGQIKAGPIWQSNGDPHGSLLTIAPIVYKEVAESNTPFDCKALVAARPIPVYTAPGQYTLQRNASVAWVVYDIFRRIRPDLAAKINLQSVINYEYVCGSGVSYRKVDGSISFHSRYQVSLAITKEVSVAQIVEGLKLSGRLMIVSDSDGQLNFVCRESLANQQPSPIQGSNDGGGVSSYTRTDNPNGSPSGIGYVAYDFNEGSIVAGSFRDVSPSIQSLPTIMRATIQDEDNQWTPDSIAVACVPAYQITQQKNQSTIPAIGLPNYDQAYRIINSKFAEIWTGNPRGDYRGSKIYEWTTSFRGLHLTLGAIVRVTCNQYGLLNQLLRIEAISPTADCQKIKITARWHDDRWYCDSFGQQF